MSGRTCHASCCVGCMRDCDHLLHFAARHAAMDNVEYERILTNEIDSVAGRLGSIQKVLGFITDREAAVQLAFGHRKEVSLDDKPCVSGQFAPA